MKKWYNENNNDTDVVISTRIRLARNFKKYFFSIKLSQQEADQMIQDIEDKISTITFKDYLSVDLINIQKMLNIDKLALMERHVISPLFIKKENNTTLLLSKDESMSVMINEEDHMRIQCLTQGMNIEKVYNQANKIDDFLEQHFEYAYDEKYGYLTSCPTNVGTGLRASYMIHVPALESTGKLQFILEAIGKFGITVRGIYGEGSQAEGSVFQISNQITLGQSEQEIIDNLNNVTNQIVEQELKIRENLLKDKRIQLEDTVYRSYGILTNARVLTSKEAMTFLSDVKLGLELGLINLKESTLNVYELMMAIQPANLQKNISKELQVEDRDIERATYIRNYLPQIIS